MGRKSESIAFYITIVLIVLFLSLGSNQVATVFSENSPIVRKHCIVIDPGHGGEDGGATSCSGILESQFNLEISQRLNALLQLLGYETKMIRNTDISIYKSGDSIAQKKVSDLKERVRITNETNNSVLLSIHQNNFPDSKYSGAQIFYSATEGSQELAKTLQSKFVSVLNKGSKRQCKKSSGIYLMEHIQCTGVLIECGFLSNPEEEYRLRSEEYQKKISCVIATAVGEYLSNT